MSSFCLAVVISSLSLVDIVGGMSSYPDLHVETILPDSRSLRIAVVTETYPPDINGVAQTISRVVDGLRRNGHEIILVRPRIEPRQAAVVENGFAEHLVRGAPIPMYRELKMGLPAKTDLVRLWLRRRPDVVHIATEGPLGWSAARAAKKLKIPTTSDFRTNFHAYSNLYGMGWLKGAIVSYLRKFHNGTECTMVPTPELHAKLSDVGFQRLEVVPRGVDTDRFQPLFRSETLRASWGADDATMVLTTVGRLAVEKNLGMTIRAWRAAQEWASGTGLQVKLVLVGEGPLGESLRQQHPEIIFAGIRRDHDLATHYASADLFLFPSQTETFGNVTLEALASGLPVVAYRCAAASQLIDPGVNGALAEIGADDGFVGQTLDIIHRMTSSRQTQAECSAAARLTALKHGWPAVVARTEQVFHRLVSPPLAGLSSVCHHDDLSFRMVKHR